MTILSGQITREIKKKNKSKDCLGFRDVFEDWSCFHIVQKALGGVLAVRPL